MVKIYYTGKVHNKIYYIGKVHDKIYYTGKVHDKKELEELYGQPVDVPPPKQDQLGERLAIHCV